VDRRRALRVGARAGLAVALVVGFALARDRLDPRALVAARLGLGVSLLALLVDTARVMAGARTPVGEDLAPHRQRAEPLVDERYERVHDPVTRFVDEGVWTSALDAVLEEAAESAGAPERDRRRAVERARETAEAPRPAGEPVAAALLAGLVVAAGAGLAVAALLRAVGLPTFGPSVLVAGLGLAATQVRARRAGARWSGLACGLAGALLVAVGALQAGVAYAGPWRLVALLAVPVALGSLELAWLGPARQPPWPVLEDQLERRRAALRRAFLVALAVGAVLFPLKPALDAAADALGAPIGAAYPVAAVLYATVAAFLAVELIGAGYALTRGRRRARDNRSRRVEALEALLDALDEHAPRPREEPPT
jgi:hypothetical protein